MGMALADDSRTPNFLFTYKDKRQGVRINASIATVFAAFLLFMATCVGISFWQERLIGDKGDQKVQLQQHLQGYNLRVDKNLILKLVGEIQNKNRTDRAIGKKYLNLAVIGEVVNLTPANIRLLSISTQLGPLQDKNLPKEDKRKKQKEKPLPKILILEGIVQGDRLC